ncbi:MAG: PrgI family protein [Parcubacteria group bacterium]
MFSNVPQFIDTEDKIVGPLTAKQLGWLATGGVLLLIAWNTLDLSSFIVTAIFVGGIFGSLAFYRPYNQPLLKFLLSSVFFAFNPKVYIWKRNYDNIKIVQKPVVKKEDIVSKRKPISNQKIKDISKILDRNSEHWV